MIKKPVQVPGSNVYQQTIIQPVVERERIRLNIKDGQEQYVEKEPKLLPTQFQENTRVQQEFIPGADIYKQYTIKPQLTAEHLEVNFQKSEPQFVTAPTKYNAPITNINTERRTYDRTFQVPAFKDVGVKVPVIHYVPEYHDVPLYIEMPPAKDKIKRNIKEIYINPKDYMISEESSESEEQVRSYCANCPMPHCHRCGRAWARGNADISALFDA